MNNGANNFGVPFSSITFLERVLASHENVRIISRHDDIVFDIIRNVQGDSLTVVCVNAYSVSLELVERVVSTFPDTNIIYFGGKWNGATGEASEFCDRRNIGLYNAGTLAPALRNRDFGADQKFNDRDNPQNGTSA
ncbi:hypothetical protein GCM10010983_38720 [Caulobacter rhizosphaerae]|jgi:hypothetical protein|nr:hypothetical protein GCM10010983_38720 [Caulobacter rhizosphaerae]